MKIRGSRNPIDGSKKGLEDQGGQIKENNI